jgi:hypothetical protein
MIQVSLGYPLADRHAAAALSHRDLLRFLFSRPDTVGTEHCPVRALGIQLMAGGKGMPGHGGASGE